MLYNVEHCTTLETPHFCVCVCVRAFKFCTQQVRGNSRVCLLVAQLFGLSERKKERESLRHTFQLDESSRLQSCRGCCLEVFCSARAFFFSFASSFARRSRVHSHPWLCFGLCYNCGESSDTQNGSLFRRRRRRRRSGHTERASVGLLFAATKKSKRPLIESSCD